MGTEGELIALSAAQAVAALRAGEIGAAELFDAYSRRVEQESIGAYLWREQRNPASDRAAELAEAPLAGVPIAVKDLFCMEGVPSTAGSRILDGYLPPYTATSIARLQRAGATVLGKTNMDEFAMGSSNENSGYSPVKNPWDETRVPGGSSGGSAAAVAAGLAPWATGTDTGGSIRQPASLCGLVGFKPTYGTVSRYGMIAFASSLDQAGPITRDVMDAALMFKHMQGSDQHDSTCTGMPEAVAFPAAESLGGLRFGVPTTIDWSGVQPGVRAIFEQSVKRLQRLGAEIVDVQLPHAEHGLSAYYLIAPAEASANLARYDGVRFGKRADADGLTAMYENTRGEGFGDEVKRRIMLGTYALSSGYYDAYYGRAQLVRTKIADDFRAAFEHCDFIVTPTSPTVAFKLGERTEDPLAMYLSDLFTVPMSLAGLPAISLPAGLATGDGAAVAAVGDTGALPVGLQIAAPAYSENKLLDAAFAFERATAFPSGPWAKGQ
ncbi:MAG: Asp-tRNA(Asn)/Glu-tRNA(Gln) amidotransferase subunit GatA [Thermoleophilia bacterium]|nr:Asp-tRNA(Asn)/Glu-tRNA(Gln) amidotransferase subunit GatA [Thermoleophilia bacterium]